MRKFVVLNTEKNEVIYEGIEFSHYNCAINSMKNGHISIFHNIADLYNFIGENKDKYTIKFVN